MTRRMLSLRGDWSYVEVGNFVGERSPLRFPAEAAGKFSSSELTLCTDSYSVSVKPLPQWRVKDPGHSAKSTGGRLHLNTHTAMTQ